LKTCGAVFLAFVITVLLLGLVMHLYYQKSRLPPGFPIVSLPVSLQPKDLRPASDARVNQKNDNGEKPECEPFRSKSLKLVSEQYRFCKQAEECIYVSSAHIPTKAINKRYSAQVRELTVKLDRYCTAILYRSPIPYYSDWYRVTSHLGCIQNLCTVSYTVINLIEQSRQEALDYRSTPDS
jgi:hypothetical protein